MKSIRLAILAFCVAFTSISAEEIDVDVDLNDTMPEFCAATFLVVKDMDEYRLWKSTYLLNSTAVLAHQTILQREVAAGTVRGSEVLDAAAECKRAREEEWIE